MIAWCLTRSKPKFRHTQTKSLKMGEEVTQQKLFYIDLFLWGKVELERQETGSACHWAPWLTIPFIMSSTRAVNTILPESLLQQCHRPSNLRIPWLTGNTKSFKVHIMYLYILQIEKLPVSMETSSSKV